MLCVVVFEVEGVDFSDLKGSALDVHSSERMYLSSTIMRGFSTFPYIFSINSKCKRSHSLCGSPVVRLRNICQLAGNRHESNSTRLTK